MPPRRPARTRRIRVTAEKLAELLRFYEVVSQAARVPGPEGVYARSLLRRVGLRVPRVERNSDRDRG